MEEKTINLVKFLQSENDRLKKEKLELVEALIYLYNTSGRGNKSNLENARQNAYNLLNPK